MNIVYQQFIFPTKETSLERIVDPLSFRIASATQNVQLIITFESELMLLEFSKSLKATVSALHDHEKIPYITTNILLEEFVSHFNKLYQLQLMIETQ
jgi:hypothetical protein